MTFIDTFAIIISGDLMNNEYEHRTYYYARVSSSDQNLDRQIQAFRDAGANDSQIISDTKSGKDLDRPGYKHLKENLLRRGDTLVVKSLDRLSRSKTDIKNELQYFKEAGIRVKILDLPTTTIEVADGQEWVIEMVNNILIEVLGSMAEQERITIHQRQAEGIAAAKAKGKHMGRPAAVKPKNWDAVMNQWQIGEITARQAMTMTGLSRSTFYRLANAEKNQSAE